MCLYITRRYVHTDGRVEIATEWVYCRYSNGRSPCINVSRRDETVQAGSSSDFPDLVSHDGASTVSSSMPATPISAISPAGPTSARYASVNYEDRSPSTSPHRKIKKYRLSFNSGSRAPRHAKPSGPRPVILQPAPPSTLGQGHRVELPGHLRTRQRQSHSDSEYDDPFVSLPSVFDRIRAEDQFKREERQRQRAELSAGPRHGQGGHDRRPIKEREDKDEHKERMLDLQEQRTEERMLDRERQREAARRRREEVAQERLNRQEQQIKDQTEAREDYTRSNEASRGDMIEQDPVERLRRQIRDGREREAQQRQQRENQANRERREQERQEYEQKRQQLQQQLEECELEEQATRQAQLDAHSRGRANESLYQDQLESARRDYEELDRRLRAHEHRAQIDGPRFGVRRNITAAQSPHLHSILGRAGPLDDAEFRRSRGHEVLEEARRSASLWDNEEEDPEVDGLRVPLIGRRNTIGGMNRFRETNYRQRMRRYPG